MKCFYYLRCNNRIRNRYENKIITEIYRQRYFRCMGTVTKAQQRYVSTHVSVMAILDLLVSSKIMSVIIFISQEQKQNTMILQLL